MANCPQGCIDDGEPYRIQPEHCLHCGNCFENCPQSDGLVLRHAYAEVPPRVEYELTDRSRSLLPLIHDLVGWALNNLSDIVKDRKAFMEKS